MPIFEGVLLPGSAGGAYVLVPDEVLDDLGCRSRFRVRGRLNDVEFHSFTMAIGGGRVCVGIRKATREAAGVGVGNVTVVEIEVDEDPRFVKVPRPRRSSGS